MDAPFDALQTDLCRFLITLDRFALKLDLSQRALGLLLSSSFLVVHGFASSHLPQRRRLLSHVFVPPHAP